MPEVIARVLASPEGPELVEVARLLDKASATERNIIFFTPVGDIKCRINWRSCSPSDLAKSGELFLIKLRSSSVAFVPKPGAVFDIGFEDYAGRISVVCLAPPQQLYPGVDLMCFLPHNSAMEKTGRLNDGAPSVVSGNPSDTVSKEGEPIVEHEKAASTDGLDFDRPRPQ